MSSPVLISILLPLLILPSVVSALPDITPILIGQGDCSSYPYTYNTGGSSADAFVFHPDQADNSSINGLQTGIIDSHLVAYESSSATSAIWFCDRGGMIKDGFGDHSLLLSASAADAELGFTSAGLKPETYAHEINGVRQDGVFLGIANVTTWVFRRAAVDADYYLIRLLAVGTGLAKEAGLQAGEFKGFLKVAPPVL